MTRDNVTSPIQSSGNLNPVKSGHVQDGQRALKRLLPWVITLLTCTSYPQDQVSAATEIRIMASNLTSGTSQKYEAPGIRILQGLDPDIVLIQEFNYLNNSTTDLDAFVDSTFGTEFHWYREGGANIPNGVISRYPIIQSGEWNDTYVSDRDFAWARIDIPGDKDLWVVSIHLLTSSSSNRTSEAKQLVSYINAQGIPASDYLVIAGDLNTASRTETCITTLSSVVSTASPYPADQAKDGDTNSGRNKPYDWVLVDADLRALEIPVAIGANSFTGGLVFDSRKYTPLSDVYPVQSGDSGASGMQHMGVIRDFLIPATTVPDPTPTPEPTPDPTPEPGPASVLITEMMYAPLSTSGPEWIELYNPGTTSVSLAGLLLTDNEGIDLAEGEYWFGSTVLGPGEYIVLGAASASYVDIVFPSGGPILNNTGDEIWLVEDPEHDGLFTTANVLEGTKFLSTWGGTNGKTLSRKCLSCDPSLSSSWASSLTNGGTPGAKNDTMQ